MVGGAKGLTGSHLYLTPNVGSPLGATGRGGGNHMVQWEEPQPCSQENLPTALSLHDRRKVLIFHEHWFPRDDDDSGENY